MIADHQDILNAPSRCRHEAPFFAFGHNMFEPDARSAEQEIQRLATFDLLMDNGLAPTDDILLRATIGADAGLLDRLVARRVAASTETEAGFIPIPPRMAFYAVSLIDTDPDSPYYGQMPAYRAILVTMIDAGIELCVRGDFGATLAERMMAKDLIAPDAMPGCG